MLTYSLKIKYFKDLAGSIWHLHIYPHIHALSKKNDTPSKHTRCLKGRIKAFELIMNKTVCI